MIGIWCVNNSLVRALFYSTGRSFVMWKAFEERASHNNFRGEDIHSYVNIRINLTVNRLYIQVRDGLHVLAALLRGISPGLHCGGRLGSEVPLDKMVKIDSIFPAKIEI
jgi:hypothetical protein